MIRSLVILSTVWWCSAQLVYNGYPWVLKPTPLTTTPKLLQYRNYNTPNTRETYVGPYASLLSNYNKVVSAYSVSHSKDARSYSIKLTGKHHSSPIETQYSTPPSLSYGIPEFKKVSSHSTSPEIRNIEAPSLTYGHPESTTRSSPSSLENIFVDPLRVSYGVPDINSELTISPLLSGQYIELPRLSFGAPEIDGDISTLPPPRNEYIESTSLSTNDQDVETELYTLPPTETPYTESLDLDNATPEMDSDHMSSPSNNQGRDLSSSAALNEDIATIDFSLEGRRFPTLFRDAFSRKRRSVTLPVNDYYSYMTTEVDLDENENTSVPETIALQTELSSYDKTVPIATSKQARPHYNYYSNIFKNVYFPKAPKFAFFTGKSIYNKHSYSPIHKHR